MNCVFGEVKSVIVNGVSYDELFGVDINLLNREQIKEFVNEYLSMDANSARNLMSSIEEHNARECETSFEEEMKDYVWTYSAEFEEQKNYRINVCDNTDYREQINQMVEIIKMNNLSPKKNYYKQLKKKLNKKYCLIEKSELIPIQKEYIKRYIQQWEVIRTLDKYFEEQKGEMSGNKADTISAKLDMLGYEADEILNNLIDMDAINFN